MAEAGTVAGFDGELSPTEIDPAGARFQGAQIAAQLAQSTALSKQAA